MYCYFMFFSENDIDRSLVSWVFLSLLSSSIASLCQCHLELIIKILQKGQY